MPLHFGMLFLRKVLNVKYDLALTYHGKWAKLWDCCEYKTVAASFKSRCYVDMAEWMKATVYL